ncbi:hypothetical protein MP228_010608 [Amoeboaphelidium protococcarum]|nr:hypothetical protein MP228_010608 [Amoeboaphelidium protococcarum]
MLPQLSYLLGVVGIFMLPLFKKGIYIDENALLVGNVALQTDRDEVLSKFVEHYDHLRSKDSYNRTRYLKAIGERHEDYECFHSADDKVLSMRIPAKRSDGSESIVISASIQENAFGVSVALALIEAFQDATFMQKNLVLIFYQPQLVNDDSSQIEQILQRSNSVGSYLALEFSDSLEYNMLDIDHVGANGLLPNMDIMSTLLTLSLSHLYMPVRLNLNDQMVNSIPNHDTKLYVGNILKMFSFMKLQFKCGIGNVNAVMNQRRAEGATLIGSTADGYSYGVYSQRQVLNLVDMYLRSMNNLLERLHHSSNFYIIIDGRWYIPMGVYIIVIALLSISLLLQSWRIIKRLLDVEVRQKFELKNYWVNFTVQQVDMSFAVWFISLNFAFGYLVFALPTLLKWVGMDQKDSHLLAIITGALYFLTLCVDIIILSLKNHMVSKWSKVTQVQLVYSGVCLIAAIAFTCTSIINFTFGFVSLLLFGLAYLIVGALIGGGSASSTSSKVVQITPASTVLKAFSKIVKLSSVAPVIILLTTPVLFIVLDQHYSDQNLQSLAVWIAQQYYEIKLDVLDPQYLMEYVKSVNALHMIRPALQRLVAEIGVIVSAYENHGIWLWPLFTMLWLPLSSIAVSLSVS